MPARSARRGADLIAWAVLLLLILAAALESMVTQAVFTVHDGINILFLVVLALLGASRKMTWMRLGLIIGLFLASSLAASEVYFGWLTVPAVGVTLALVFSGLYLAGLGIERLFLPVELAAQNIEGQLAKATLARMVEAVQEGILLLDAAGIIIYANRAAEKMLDAEPGQAAGLSGMEALNFKKPEEVLALWEQIIAYPGTKMQDERSLRATDSLERRYQAQIANYLEVPEFNAVLICIRDITDQYQIGLDYEALLEHERKRSAYLAALLESAAALSKSLDPKLLVFEVARQMTVLMDVEACAISGFDPRANSIQLISEYAPAVWNFDSKWSQPFYIKEDMVSDQVLRTLQPVQYRLESPDLPDHFRDYMNELELKSILLLPLVVQDEAIGLVELMERRQPRRYSVSEIVVTQSMANLAAIAIRQANLFIKVQQQSDDLERRVQERTEDLNQVALAMMGRETRMIELKQVVQGLREQLLAHGIAPLADDPLAEWLKDTA